LLFSPFTLPAKILSLGFLFLKKIEYLIF